MQIRLEEKDDVPQITKLHLASFDEAGEAKLVERMRGKPDFVLSLVAVEDHQILGHVLFSKMEANFRVLGLGPIAVVMSRRRQGIAAKLINAGFALAKDQNWEGVFVLGNIEYYKRFGFSTEIARAYQCKFSCPNLMALVFNMSDKSGAGTFSVGSGSVQYSNAFDDL